MEKIITDHHHSHEEHEALRPLLVCNTHADPSEHQLEHGDHDDHEHDYENIFSPKLKRNPLSNGNISEKEFEELDEAEFKRKVQTQRMIANRMSFVKSVKKSIAQDRLYMFIQLQNRRSLKTLINGLPTFSK